MKKTILKGVFVEFDPVNRNSTNYYIPKCKICGELDSHVWENGLCRICDLKERRKEKIKKILKDIDKSNEKIE
jgi:ribosomal protein S14